ncbi:MAG: hypothetical protein HQ559_12045 [Lentisphaerae bacterium]|nr:hypothetical protein [Lentisphaerota bacterium]
MIQPGMMSQQMIMRPTIGQQIQRFHMETSFRPMHNFPISQREIMRPTINEQIGQFRRSSMGGFNRPF